MSELASYGLVKHPVPGDGNCLFHALSIFFVNMQALEMRQQCVQYIIAHPDLFAADIIALYGCDVQTYCARMSQPRVFGDGIVLQAFVLAHNCSVYLFMPTGVTKLGTGPRNLAIVRNGEHYDAAVPRAK